eukprot:gene17518-biopygen10685
MEVWKVPGHAPPGPTRARKDGSLRVVRGSPRDGGPVSGAGTERDAVDLQASDGRAGRRHGSRRQSACTAGKRLGRGWVKVGKRLGRGWAKVGKRLGKGCGELGKRSGRCRDDHGGTHRISRYSLGGNVNLRTAVTVEMLGHR